MTLKVALIGFGYWGPKLARNIQNSSHFEIDSIIDTSKKNLAKAQKSFPLANRLSNFKKLNLKKINLVVISSPTKTHYQMANYFLKHVNVLIEKPLALNLKHVSKLIFLRLKKKLLKLPSLIIDITRTQRQSQLF